MPRFLRLCLLAIATITALNAAVYRGNTVQCRQPDGSLFTMRIWGDEFSVHAELPTGWTVIKGADRWWYVAQPMPGGGIEPSPLRVGTGDPATLGVAQHLRQTQAQRAAEAAARRSLLHRDSRGRVDSPLLRQVRAARHAARPGVRLAAAPPQALPPAGPTLNTRNGVTLMVSFPDDDPGSLYTLAQVDAFCNGNSYTTFSNNGSVKEYFTENSLGRLTYTNTVINYYVAAHPRSYYNDPLQTFGVRAAELVTEALNAADANGFDFNACDDDGDTIIDAVNVFYSGNVAFSDGLWPHMDYITWNSNDGMQAASYQVCNMNDAATGGLSLGGFCHENGHMLCDFPDLYDYGQDSDGVGDFCLMASGSWSGSGLGKNPTRVCGYLALAAGWRDAVDLVGAVSGTRTIAAESTTIFRYLNLANPTEYFLFENRNRGSASGRDVDLPGSGLAIWHVDELGINDDQSYTKNATHSNYECALVQADDLRHLENLYDVNGDSRDLWYASNGATGYDNRFEDGSGVNPQANDARWWDGTASGLILSSISAAGTTMTFAYGETTLALAAAAYTVAEGNSGTTLATISVVRTGDLKGAASLTWTTVAGGSATLADLDYPGSSGSVTWGNNVGGTKTFTVAINGDTKFEGDETINLTIASATPGILMGLSAATLTVSNDDAVILAPGSLELTAYAITASEGTATLAVSAQRVGGSNSGAVSVPWTLLAGTATAGVDYTGVAAAMTGSFSWADLEGGVKTINIDLNNELIPETDETFRIVLGTPTGGAVAPTPNAATLTIENDDVEVYFTSDPITVTEPSTGTALRPIRVRHRGTVHGTVTVDYHLTASGTAVAGLDFTDLTAITDGTLTWTPATTSDPDILLPVMGDGLGEDMETLSIGLLNPVGVILGTPGSATININDYAPPVSETLHGTSTGGWFSSGGCGAGASALLLGAALAGVVRLRRRR